MLSLTVFLIFLFIKLGQLVSVAHETSMKPNIILILADDLGWNDVSFHGANQIPTPNIDALAYNGIILNNYYNQLLCTPSRTALMTGKYPTSLGMQHSVLLETEPRGLPLNHRLLPQYLKQAGYKTHLIGKWHLGYYKKEYTPTYRGFDSFFGYWNGLKDYYTHLVESSIERWVGLDIRRNTSVAWDAIGKYSTDLFTQESIKLIENHNLNEPFFLYLSHLAVHSGNQYDPFQAPDEEIAKFHYIKDPERRVYAAMVSKLDQSVGMVVEALKRRNMLNNSIILFMSDNGAPTHGVHYNRGSNYPLRGMKAGVFDGATRGVAAIWSPLIKNPQRVSNEFMSIVDWLPTFVSAAGLNPSKLDRFDGIDMWPTLIYDKPSPRTELLINIDDIGHYASIRVGDYKYIKGDVSENNDINWYGDSGRTEMVHYDLNKVLTSKTGQVFASYINQQQMNSLNSIRPIPRNQTSTSVTFSINVLNEKTILQLRQKAEISCNVPHKDKVFCDPSKKACLYNIKNDPCEMIDLSSREPYMLQFLRQRLATYTCQSFVPASNVDRDPRSNPIYWNNTWVNWQNEHPFF